MIGRLGRSVAFSVETRWTAGARAYSDAAAATPDSPSVSGSDDAPIFAACVLQRLPLLRAQPSKTDVDHLSRSRRRALEGGELKDYPEIKVSSEDDHGMKKRDQEPRTFSPVPKVTAADTQGDVRSMRRRLGDSLYLLVRRKAGGVGGGGGGRQPGPGATAAAAAGSSKPAAGSGGGDEVGWSFPTAANDGTESISDTAQRALFGSLSRSHPVFFVGHGPMAHLGARPKGTTFFLLAQAVDDPWDTKLAGGAALEHAWVTKQEMLSGGYLADARLRELVSKML